MKRSAAQAWFLALAICLVSCAEAPEDHTSQLETSSTEEQILAPEADTNDIAVDVYVDPCENVTTSSGPLWCTCNPECCQSQMWFCQPAFGDINYYKKEVFVDICDDQGMPCVTSTTVTCPPLEIIYEGECTEAYECPPTAQSLDYGWQYCEMPDGSVGKQNVKCEKGKLSTTPCQPCDPEVCDGDDNDCDGLVDEDITPAECLTSCGEGVSVCVDGVMECFGPSPQEEICDGLDNDCDGLTDEDQLNVCGECGMVPIEECNAYDDDCDGFIDEELVNMCSTPCGTGVEICKDGSWLGCTANQPSDEICDGLDNDCNGLIDDGITCLCTVQDVGKLFPCSEQPLLCGQGYKTCECIDDECKEIATTECFAACHWFTDPPGLDPNCDPYVGYPLSQEACNAFDDNCNALIDEDLIEGCYTGPADTLGVGICEPGSMVCEMGTWGAYDENSNFIPNMCMDEVVPVEEECNGIDDDCDGVVDGGEEIPETDILFIVDGSGSMMDEMSAVLVALNQFASSFSLEDKIRWGLVVGPVKIAGEYEERLLRVSDISLFEDFLTDFSSLGNTINMNGGSEMLLDAFALSLQNVTTANLDLPSREWDDDVAESLPPKDQFKLSWRPGADKIVIIFSDEIEQSYLIPEVTVDEAIETCKGTPQLKTYTFSKLSFVWNWDEIATQCGGKNYKLSNDSTEMYNYLMEILDEVCAL